MTQICRHHPEDMGWHKSESWGCKRCGWVAPITIAPPSGRPDRNAVARAVLLGAAVAAAVWALYGLLVWLS